MDPDLPTRRHAAPPRARLRISPAPVVCGLATAAVVTTALLMAAWLGSTGAHAAGLAAGPLPRVVRAQALARAVAPPAPRASVARVASVNSAVPAFTANFSQSPTSPPKLTGLTIHQIYAGYGLVACLHCNGHFGKISSTKSSLTFRFHGNGRLSAQARYAVLVINAGRIGRYKIYAVSPGSATVPPGQHVLSEGCVPPDLPITANPTVRGELSPLQLLRSPRSFPKIACQPTIPHGDRLSLHPALEAPEVGAQIIRKDGPASLTVKGTTWLTEFQAHGNCRADPWGELAVSGVRALVRQRLHAGSYHGLVSVFTDARGGHICAYLQTGGTYFQVPDGPVVLERSIRYYGGDTVTVTPPAAPTPPNTAATVTLTGHASQPMELYDLDGTAPCLRTAQGEYRSASSFDYGRQPVARGNFSIQRVTQPLTATSYHCTYLQLGQPTAKGLPTGPALAAGSSVITVGVPAVAAQRDERPAMARDARDDRSVDRRTRSQHRTRA